MAMDIKCKLLDKLAVQSGTSARGPWSKQDFIVETLEQYPFLLSATELCGIEN